MGFDYNRCNRFGCGQVSILQQDNAEQSSKEGLRMKISINR